MTRTQAILSALSMALATLSGVAAAQDAGTTLSVRFTGIETPEGAVMGAVFNNEDAYNGKGAPVRQIMITADKAEVEAQLAGLAPGTYAIKVFHDIDGDHAMSTNPYGMPIEPFAFSNNAVGNMGPARWADAAFQVTPGANVHTIVIK